MTDWDSELKKIDRQLEGMADKALVLAPDRSAPSTERAEVATQRANTRSWPAFLRLTLAAALGVGILFWPYPKQCGPELGGYLAAVGAVFVGGLWSSVWTWRHRTARAHVLSLLLVIWGLVLGALEVLPHAGYAKGDPSRPAGWTCRATGTTPRISTRTEK